MASETNFRFRKEIFTECMKGLAWTVMAVLEEPATDRRDRFLDVRKLGNEGRHFQIKNAEDSIQEMHHSSFILKADQVDELLENIRRTQKHFRDGIFDSVSHVKVTVKCFLRDTKSFDSFCVSPWVESQFRNDDSTENSQVVDVNDLSRCDIEETSEVTLDSRFDQITLDHTESNGDSTFQLLPTLDENPVLRMSIPLLPPIHSGRRSEMVSMRTQCLAFRCPKAFTFIILIILGFVAALILENRFAYSPPPNGQPTHQPSYLPSHLPSHQPSHQPSVEPTIPDRPTPAVDHRRQAVLSCARKLSKNVDLSNANTSTPQWGAVKWIAHGPGRKIDVPEPCHWNSTFGQLYALIIVRDSLKVPDVSWYRMEPPFNDFSDVCRWKRVVCGNDGSSIARLILNHAGLNGTIPVELGPGLMIRSTLIDLHLENNAIHGSLPSELGNADGLKSLWLQDNYLTGTIPASLGQLTKLEQLLLNDNGFTGSVPVEICQLPNLFSFHADCKTTVECDCHAFSSK